MEGTTGKLLAVQDSVRAAAETRGIYALHPGRFSDIATRRLYFIVSCMGTAMVGTGLLILTIERRQKLPIPDRPWFAFFLVERLNTRASPGCRSR